MVPLNAAVGRGRNGRCLWESVHCVVPIRREGIHPGSLPGLNELLMIVFTVVHHHHSRMKLPPRCHCQVMSRACREFLTPRQMAARTEARRQLERAIDKAKPLAVLHRNAQVGRRGDRGQQRAREIPIFDHRSLTGQFGLTADAEQKTDSAEKLRRLVRVQVLVGGAAQHGDAQERQRPLTTTQSALDLARTLAWRTWQWQNSNDTKCCEKRTRGAWCPTMRRRAARRIAPLLGCTL